MNNFPIEQFDISEQGEGITKRAFQKFQQCSVNDVEPPATLFAALSAAPATAFLRQNFVLYYILPAIGAHSDNVM